MARTQSKNFPEIRRAILQRAAAVFAEQGYANTSIADLAQANGTSRGLLYHYFESKEALLSEMLNAHLDMMLAEVTAAARTSGDATERFRAAAGCMVRINAASKDLQIVLLHDLRNLGADDRQVIVAKQRQILDVVTGLIGEIETAGRLDDHNRMAHTMMFIGMINYTYVWYDPDGPVGPDEYAQMVLDTYLNGLNGLNSTRGGDA